METDAVDTIVEEWEQERPDLDTAAKQVTGRVIRLASLFQRAYADVFAEMGLNEGDYGVLVPLRRSGADRRLSPTELAQRRMMTSGGMTAALDRLERKGLVARVANPSDRRSSLVQLTDAGRDVVDRAMQEHVGVEARLVAGLDPADRATLTTLLRTLLVDVERQSTGGPSS